MHPPDFRKSRMAARAPLRVCHPGARANPNIALLIGFARDPASDVAKLKELRAMIKEDEDDWRRRTYLEALAQAKSEFPPLIKMRLVDYPHKDGRGRTSYKYEDLADASTPSGRPLQVRDHP